MLQQDTRLKRPVTLHGVGVTLDDLLHSLSAKDLTLSADSSCGSQKLQIRLNGKPLSVLMQSLSQLLSGSWKPNADGSGYIFNQTPETIARRDRWWQLFLMAREPAKEAQRKFILARMRARPVLHRIYHHSNSPENEDRQEEIHDLAHQQFFRDLPPALQMRIANQMQDKYFKGLLNGFVAPGYQYEGAIVVPLTELPKPDQDLILNEETTFFDPDHPDLAAALVQFDNSGESISVGLMIHKGLGATPETANMFDLRVDLCPSAYVASVYHNGIADAIQKLGDTVPAKWKELAAYQASRVWPNDLPQTLSSATFPPQGKYRADVLDWLADQAGIEFVADYYTQRDSSQMSDVEKAHPLTGNLKETLDIVAKHQDVSWLRTEEGIYLVRNNCWYRDDRLEIPTAWLQRWHRQLETLKVVPADRMKGARVYDLDTDPVHLKARMDWETDIASKLTDWQLPSLVWAAMEQIMPASTKDQTAYFSMPDTPASASSASVKVIGFPFAAVGTTLLQELSIVRFYAGLTEAQREALVIGQLSLSTLSPAQQEQVRYLSPTLPYLAGHQSVWLGLKSQVDVIVTPVGRGVLFLDSYIHLVALPAY
jgi:hypothetical protein